MCPIIADSLDSFEETTTAACAAGSAEKMSTAASASDFRNLAMGHLRAADQDRLATGINTPCRLPPSPSRSDLRPQKMQYDTNALWPRCPAIERRN
jgi:hypothetical protein